MRFVLPTVGARRIVGSMLFRNLQGLQNKLVSHAALRNRVVRLSTQVLRVQALSIVECQRVPMPVIVASVRVMLCTNRLLEVGVECDLTNRIPRFGGFVLVVLQEMLVGLQRRCRNYTVTGNQE